MGKQSKRKNKRRGGASSGGHHRPTGLADDPLLDHPPVAAAVAAAAAPGGTSTSTGTIVARIRHVDPRVRHASLVALSRTLYDASALEKSASAAAAAAEEGRRRRKKKDASSSSSSSSSSPPPSDDASDPVLLRALSERVLDVDVPCATIAVGCLSNYVNFCHHHQRDNREGGGEEDVASTVLVPILMRRVLVTSATIHSMMTTTTTTAKMTSTSDKNKDDDKLRLRLREQWSLQSLSLSTLAGLIENRPRSILWGGDGNDDGDGGGGGGTTNVPMVGELLSALDLARSALACERRTGEGTDPIAEAAVGVARALHSLFDDNPSLVESLPPEGESTTTTTATSIMMSSSPPSPPSLDVVVSRLVSIVPDERLPNAARMHACGALLALRGIVVLGRRGVVSPVRGGGGHRHRRLASRLQSCANDVVVPHLSSFFDVRGAGVDVGAGVVARHGDDGGFIVLDASDSIPPNKTTTTTMTTIQRILSRMISLSNRLSKIKDDESMEMQVVSRVNKRGESARSIARRQQEKKKMMMTTNDESKGSPRMMQVEGDEGSRECNANSGGESGKEEKDDVVMVVALDGDNEEGDGNGDKNMDQKREQMEDELREELDAVVSTWRDIVSTQTLALELVANLCSGSNDDENEDNGDDDDGGDDDDEGMIYGESDDDNDEHMWDSDDEARLISAAAVSNDASPDSNKIVSAITQFERETYESMANLPLKILRFFRDWVDFPAAFAAASTVMVVATPDDSNDGSIIVDVKTENASKTFRLPVLVSKDIDEVLSTCALCLGNVLACNLLVDGSNRAGADEEKNSINNLFWQELASMLEDNDHNHLRHVTSLMLSLLLRNQPRSRIALVDATTLDRLIFLLLSKNYVATSVATAVKSDGDKINDDETILQIQRSIILILGTLGTIAHPESMDAKVCRALLSRLTLAMSNGGGTPLVGGDGRERQQQQQRQPQKQQHEGAKRTARFSIIITHEILNVLMDMYGSDDCHEQVFVDECVLDHFTKCLPWFKRTIKWVGANSNSSRSKRNPMEEEGFVWNETALNATRFIKYKQGQ